MNTLQSMIWRLLRGAVAAAVAQTLSMNLDWTNPTVAIRTAVISFVTGFLLAISVGIRDTWGDPNKDKGVINKLPI